MKKREKGRTHLSVMYNGWKEEKEEDGNQTNLTSDEEMIMMEKRGEEGRRMEG